MHFDGRIGIESLGQAFVAQLLTRALWQAREFARSNESFLADLVLLGRTLLLANRFLRQLEIGTRLECHPEGRKDPRRQEADE